MLGLLSLAEKRHRFVCRPVTPETHLPRWREAPVNPASAPRPHRESAPEGTPPHTFTREGNGSPKGQGQDDAENGTAGLGRSPRRQQLGGGRFPGSGPGAGPRARKGRGSGPRGSRGGGAPARPDGGRSPAQQKPGPHPAAASCAPPTRAHLGRSQPGKRGGRGGGDGGGAALPLSRDFPPEPAPRAARALRGPRRGRGAGGACGGCPPHACSAPCRRRPAPSAAPAAARRPPPATRCRAPTPCGGPGSPARGRFSSQAALRTPRPLKEPRPQCEGASTNSPSRRARQLEDTPASSGGKRRPRSSRAPRMPRGHLSGHGSRWSPWG